MDALFELPEPADRLARILDEADYSPFKPHPLLEVFPLLPLDEFAAFVASVKRIGLIYPITITHDRRTLIDGRIRYLACRSAHVEPTYRLLPERYTEKMILDYIRSYNLIRKSHSAEERELIAAGAGESA
jgi:hypothetical protein